MRKQRSLLTTLLATLALLFAAATASAQEPCGDAVTCASGFCVDGVCCDSACDGACQGCSAAAKGSGDDGICGNVAAGTVCTPSTCDPSSFAFVPADVCDENGACIDGGPAESCLVSDGICQFDACHDLDGCQIYFAPDGHECDADLTCNAGVCGIGAGGTPNVGGAGGEGGEEGEGGSTGTGFGGAGGEVIGGSTDVSTSCSCNTVGGRAGGLAPFVTLILAAAASLRRRD